MSDYLKISITFLDQRFHGRCDGGQPEWPPSPLRVFQALVAAAAQRCNERSKLVQAAPALRWLETLPHPEIVAGAASPSKYPYRLYVPDNVGDKVARSWSRGREASIAGHRTEKDVRPVHLTDDTFHLLYPIESRGSQVNKHIQHLTSATRSITHLGWGIDMVAANAAVIDHGEAGKLSGHRWRSATEGGASLRVPVNGTLADLMRKHNDFLNRLDKDGFHPVPPLTKFDVQSYRRDDDPAQRPFRVFELRRTDGSRFRYPHRRFIHIAGMLRHLAIEAMKLAPPKDVDEAWIETYVAGHAKEGATEHRQLSYLPLPSLGHIHADPGVRRVMLAGSPGEKSLLDYIARRLAGQILKPERGDEFTQRDLQDPPRAIAP